MGRALTYRVRDAEGKLIVEGGGATCAELLGVTPSTFYCAVSHLEKREYRGYIIECVKEEKDNRAPSLDADAAEAARKWDEFVTPIRQRYGLQVHKGGR